MIRRAKEVLAQLNEGKEVAVRGPKKLAPFAEEQLSMDFEAASSADFARDEIKRRVEELDINTMTPMGALNFLFELKNLVE